MTPRWSVVIRRQGLDSEPGEVLLALEVVAERRERAVAAGIRSSTGLPGFGNRVSPRPPLSARASSIGFPLSTASP